LKAGDVVVFPEGPGGAHQVINRSDSRCRVLILSSKAPVAIIHYPDSGKIGLWSQPDVGQTVIPDGPELDYWDGEA
jgi:uncharacterized cupin superfamily protein